MMDPGVAIDALPPLDVIAVSHTHYDHLDKPAVKQIARALAAEGSDAPLSPRAVGAILRRLGLSPRKRQGNYVLPAEEVGKLAEIGRRYGVAAEEVE